MNNPAVTPPDPDDQEGAVMKVSLVDLTVRHATPLAIAWMGLPAERLLNRSLLLSLPHLGQTLTVAISGGLGPARQPLPAAVATPTGEALTVYARRVDAEAILECEAQASGVPHV
jgi:hypothetical protein